MQTLNQISIMNKITLLYLFFLPLTLSSQISIKQLSCTTIEVENFSKIKGLKNYHLEKMISDHVWTRVDQISDISKAKLLFSNLQKNGWYRVSWSKIYPDKSWNSKTYTSNSIQLVCEDPESENSLFVFPNPTNSNLNIEFMEAKDKDVKLQIFNYSGKLMIENHISDFSGFTNINLADFLPGFYLLKIDYNTNTKISKFIFTDL